MGKISQDPRVLQAKPRRKALPSRRKRHHVQRRARRAQQHQKRGGQKTAGKM